MPLGQYSQITLLAAHLGELKDSAKGVRPEQISLSAAGTGERDATVRSVSYFGHDAIVELDVTDELRGHVVRARVVGLTPPEPGDRVALTVMGPVRTFPRAS